MKNISFTNYIKGRRSSIITPARLLGKKSPRFYSKVPIVGFLFHEMKEKSGSFNILDDHREYIKFLNSFQEKYSANFDFGSFPQVRPSPGI